MIQPINFYNVNMRHLNFRGDETQQKTNNNQQTQTKPAELAGYKTSQAVLANKNITIKNDNNPVEITSKLNKVTPGKSHLFVPSIHVYEFPNTKLRVFIDKNPNMGDSNTVESRLFVTDKNNTQPVLQEELSKRMLADKISQNIPNAILDNSKEHYGSGFFTVVAKTNSEGPGYFDKLNKIIANPEFTQKELGEAKASLIQDMNNTDDSKNIKYILSKKSDKQSKKHWMKEIDNITLDEVNKGYKKALKNSKATYFITLNDKLYDNNKTNTLLKDLNENMPELRKNGKSRIKPLKQLTNKKSAIFVKDKNVNGTEFDYPYKYKDLKEVTTGYFASLLLLFNNPAYYEEGVDVKNDGDALSLKRNNKKVCTYQNLNFHINKPEFPTLTPQRVVNMQKETAKMVNDTDFTVTLQDMKKAYKEGFDNRINKEYKPDVTNENLADYGSDIFNIYESIDSIQTSDVKKHINKYIIKQEPIVRVGENSQVTLPENGKSKNKAKTKQV